MQRKHSFPACVAAVKFYFIVLRRAVEKPDEKGSAAGPRKAPRSPDLPPGLSPPWAPFPPFGKVKFIAVTMWSYTAYARTQYN